MLLNIYLVVHVVVVFSFSLSLFMPNHFLLTTALWFKNISAQVTTGDIFFFSFNMQLAAGRPTPQPNQIEELLIGTGNKQYVLHCYKSLHTISLVYLETRLYVDVCRKIYKDRRLSLNNFVMSAKE